MTLTLTFDDDLDLGQASDLHSWKGHTQKHMIRHFVFIFNPMRSRDTQKMNLMRMAQKTLPWQQQASITKMLPWQQSSTLANLNRLVSYFVNLKGTAGPLFVPRKPPQRQDYERHGLFIFEKKQLIILSGQPV